MANSRLRQLDQSGPNNSRRTGLRVFLIAGRIPVAFRRLGTDRRWCPERNTRASQASASANFARGFAVVRIKRRGLLRGSSARDAISSSERELHEGQQSAGDRPWGLDQGCDCDESRGADAEHDCSCNRIALEAQICATHVACSETEAPGVWSFVCIFLSAARRFLTCSSFLSQVQRIAQPDYIPSTGSRHSIFPNIDSHSWQTTCCMFGFRRLA